MIFLFINSFKANNKKELNEFILKVLELGELYIKFLISKNKLYLPGHLDPKDAAIDLLAELFVTEDDCLLKFRDFFQNNFSGTEINNETDFERYLRGFIYTVIQNNLQNIYRDNDPVTFNIYRNIKQAVIDLDYHTSMHFSDKYIHAEIEIDFHKEISDREGLLNIVYSNNLHKNISNIKYFVNSLLECLKKSEKYAAAVRMSDLVSAIKSLFAYNYAGIDNNSTDKDSLLDKLNLKFILDDVKYSFTEKLNRYISKNELSKNFKECMYNIIDEIIFDLNEGNSRKSVMELVKKHYKTDDKKIFYKVQYCVELFEGEIARQFRKESPLIG